MLRPILAGKISTACISLVVIHNSRPGTVFHGTVFHKAKGLEWENVYISNDFLDLVKYGKVVNPKNFEKNEFNLIYVAVTRLMGGLKFNKESSIIEFIKKTRELH